ncbi:MAG: methyltransferase regulatory domain-containing protein [Rickettsiaceae bacterium]|nr:methyltransferase regulatory domain-containing protein [Rickettsiaceae bacterium]
MITNNSYDKVPYESNPYPQSSPSHLRTLGVLFGMNPPALAKARVLELGCSSGGNLMPFAHSYPHSECVGVDLSNVQIEEGKTLTNKLGIKNLELKHMSIHDVDESFGKFDYIIAHGVFSWVPVEVQNKMLEIANNNLTENGIAYISYNTLPGWNMVRSIRDMMLYHSAGFENPSEKIAQARLLLQFLKESTEGSNSPYSTMLKNESDLLAQQPDYYLRHDHLEDENHQFYFNEFMQKADSYGLQYLADSTISSMYVGNLPQKIAEKLSEIKDIIRSEQYMDYVTNRRFRSTLLCKKSVRINRNLTNEDINKFYISIKATPEKPLSEVNLEDNTEVLNFYFNDNKDISASTGSKYLKAILYTLIENKLTPLKVDKIAKLAAEKLINTTASDILPDLTSNTMKMVLSGHLTITSEEPVYAAKIKSKPQISDLARVQAEFTRNYWVTNYRHERVAINELDKFAFKYFDGKHSYEEIQDKVFEAIKGGAIVLSRNDKRIDDDSELKTEVNGIFKEYGERVRDLALLS